jgi:hypothetical protein
VYLLESHATVVLFCCLSGCLHCDLQQHVLNGHSCTVLQIRWHLCVCSTQFFGNAVWKVLAVRAVVDSMILWQRIMDSSLDH